MGDEMTASMALLAFAAAAAAGLSLKALREHRDVLRRRAHLLDAAGDLFAGSRISIAPDSFPVLDGSLPDDRRIRIELIADTLVFRRLPQLWLKLTLAEPDIRRRPRIGALSRPTGAEFYSLVHDLPERIDVADVDNPLLIRGDRNLTAQDVEQATAMFRMLFRDPAMKETVIMPRGVRLVRQVAEGDRGAHLLLRQVRFPVDEISPDLIHRAVEDLQALSRTLEGERLLAA